MKNNIVRLLFFFLLTASTAFGADYFTLYKERIAGAEQYSWVDPVIDTSGALAGFIYADTVNHRLLIETQSIHREIPIAGYPKKTVNRWIASDSIIVYCMFRSFNWYDLTDNIGVASLYADTFDWHDTIPPIVYEWDASVATDSQNIRLVSLDNSSGSALLFETFVTQTWWDVTQGVSGKAGTQTMIFDSELRSILLRDSYYDIGFGTIDGNDTTEYVGFNNSLYYWDYSDLDNPGNSGREQGTQNIIKRAPVEQPLVTWSADNCNSKDLFVGDFRSDYLYDEVIYVGCQQAANVPTSGHGYVAACFSFASSQRQLLWYNYEDRWDKLDYWYEDERVLAGSRGTNVAVFLNVRNGIPGDSAVFSHDISNFRYFESGSNPKQLNFVGRVHDTIIVYQFDAITEADEPKEPTLPAQVSLSQNYPNPFNPTTTIAFEIPRRATVKLVIYNALGQKVRMLVNESLPAGSYSRIWDGKTDNGQSAASGMYFYQVSGDSFSQSKKMLLLK